MLLTGNGESFCFEEAGRSFGINPRLLYSIAEVESGLNQQARGININNTEDIGLMQVNSSWISKLSFDRERLFSDSCYNVRAGARILSGCINTYGYNWKAVGCYNAVSTTKRIAYSWKIFNALKAEKKHKYYASVMEHGIRVKIRSIYDD
ncbi:MAG: lytic transglycosylase domain-containing protein [Nitrospirae bacterium YQR-1]